MRDRVDIEAARAALLRACILPDGYDLTVSQDALSSKVVIRVGSATDRVGAVELLVNRSPQHVIAAAVAEIQRLVATHQAMGRIVAEQHKRMKAAALNRRKRLLPPMHARRATWPST